MAQRALLGLLGANLGLNGYLLYDTRRRTGELHEEMEARMDEVEGTLRGHIGLIHDSLERIEGRQTGKAVQERSKGGMSEKGEAEYLRRGKDERKKSTS